ncbi:hypothetical protein CLOM_g15487 [Closterium sp. NIES-68]|nr:hypothetical protein CLOM_g6718 [Closterium sp. NIES-68]GJP56425.1 hypothetical protein CLOM_g15487 [Closterium sp. NIES-68]
MCISKDQIGSSRKFLRQYKEKLTSLSQIEFENAIGLCLGDVSLQKSVSNHEEFRIKFEWGDKHKDYAFHVYNIFQRWCLSETKRIERRNANGKIVVSWRFQTITHRAFLPLANLFLDAERNYRKSIRPGIVKDHLTDRAFAYWYMDDGSIASKNRLGTVLHTQGFDLSEVQILCQELTEKFALKCWPKLNKGKYCIVISGHSFDIIISLLSLG